MPTDSTAWIAFNLFVLVMLALDLGVFHRQAHAVSFKEASAWSVFWIALALIFNVGIYSWKGSEAGTEFLTGYLIEKSLSVDNIFVFLTIFTYFRIPQIYQHNVFAILGLRSLYFMLAGAINSFAYLHYGLAAILAFVGTKMLLADIYKFPVHWALGIIAFLLLTSIVASIVVRRRAHTMGVKDV